MRGSRLTLLQYKLTPDKQQALDAFGDVRRPC